MSRTSRTSRIQREVIHAQGHSGSNQRSTRAGAGALSVTASPSVFLTAAAAFNQRRWRPVPAADPNHRRGRGTHGVGSSIAPRVAVGRHGMAAANLSRADHEPPAARLDAGGYVVEL